MNQTEPPGDRVPSLREYAGVLRLRKWSIAAVALLTVGAATFFALRQTPLFRSEAEVLVEAPTLSPAQPADPPNLETEKKLATSLFVGQIAGDRLGSAESVQNLLSGLAVEAETSTEILVFAYLHPEPGEAQRRAQAFAEAYLEYRRQRVLDQLVSASGSVRERIRVVDQQLEDINQQLTGTNDPGERSTLETRADSLAGQLSFLQQQLSELAAPETLRVGEIVAPADLPSATATPNYPLTLGVAAAMGLILGVGLAFLRERLDDRLRGRADLEAHASMPVLAVVPRVSEWKRPKRPFVVTIAAPGSVAAEAYRTLRMSLVFAASRRKAKVLVVTSPEKGEGKTATVANLGVVLAQAGRRVVLLSADLRKPRLHGFFGLDNDAGLTRLLAEEIPPEQAFLRTAVQNLLVIPSGPIPGNPAELLGSDAMAKFVGEVRAISDFILIDSPPVLPVADVLALVPLADAVLLVAEGQRTTRSGIEQARNQLDQVSANTIGAVLNNFDPAKASGYRESYRHYTDPYVSRQPTPSSNQEQGRRTLQGRAGP